MKKIEDIKTLKKRIKELEKENDLLKKKNDIFYTSKKTVKTPSEIAPLFDKVSEIVKNYLDKVFIDYALIGSTFAYKVPNKKAILAPHQEWTMVDEDKYVCITCWIPLMDITHNNGVVYVLPGSHLQKYRTIRGIGIDFYYSKYNDEVYAYSIPVLSKAGHALIMNQNLIHYSTPNFSKEVRRALITSVKSAAASGTFLYYKSKERDEIEKYLVEDDFLMKSEDFFYDIASKPHGQFLEVKKNEAPEYSRNQIQQLFEDMLLKSEYCNSSNDINRIKRSNFFRRIRNFFNAL